jgi:hypothetical protein
MENTLIKNFTSRKHAIGYISTSALKWPRQAMPSLHTFSVWSTNIKIITSSLANGKIVKPLGIWKTFPLQSRKYTMLIHKDLNYLILSKDSIWWKIEKSHDAKSKIFFNKKTQMRFIVDNTIYDYIPVETEETPLFYAFNAREYKHVINKNTLEIRLPTKPNGLQNYINDDKSCFGNILKSVQVIDESFIHNNAYLECLIASDGGSKG